MLSNVNLRPARGSAIMARRAVGLTLFSTLALVLVPSGRLLADPILEPDLPSYLRDRGTGVRTSMFGTYVRKGELLVYPFVEWYRDRNLEYKPSELGHTGDTDYRGVYSASEQLLFLGYGISQDLALELEGAVIAAEVTKAADDPSTTPYETEEYGVGDVEGQIRWRFQRENEHRPEMFSYFETTFPLQKNRKIIGTQDWEFKLGAGATRGYGFGTMTVRAAVEYSGAENKVEAGEYAIEYLRRLSPSWRVYSGIEGNQIDEIEFINEAQWFLQSNMLLKANLGIGLTPNATDFAPELGVMFSF